jgi:hypothetical protein
VSSANPGSRAQDTGSSRAYDSAVARSAKTSGAPAFVIPMAAVSVTELPEGDEWLYELKLDGSPYSAIVTQILKVAGVFTSRPRAAAFAAGARASVHAGGLG